MTRGHAAGAARYDDDGTPAREDVLAEVHPSFAERRAEVDREARAAPRDPVHFDHFHHFDRLPSTGGRRARHAVHHPDHPARAGSAVAAVAEEEAARGAAPVDDPVGWGATGPDVPGWYTAAPAPLPVPPVTDARYRAPDHPAPVHPAPVHPAPVHPASVHPAPVHPALAPGARDPAVSRTAASPTAVSRTAATHLVAPGPAAAVPDADGLPTAARRLSRRGTHRLAPRVRPGEGERLRSGAELVDLLTTEGLVRPRRPRPESGWRRALWELSGGRMNPGDGAAGQDRAELVHRIRTPLRGTQRIAVISVKGGVGKTTVSACLGLTFASLRTDRVLAMDANPDMGTLADRLTGDSAVTVQHLLDHLGAVDATSINDIEQFVSAVGRLHVLAGGQEPCDGQAFTRDEYEEAVAALSDCYNVLITDSGTGVNHSAMEGTVAAADGVVIVGAPTVDAASRASMTLEWLENIGRGELARNAVVALSLDRASPHVDRRVVVEHFAPRCRAVVEVPSDPHLATGGRIDLAACRRPTRDAFLVLAAELADAFPAYEW